VEQLSLPKGSLDHIHNCYTVMDRVYTWCKGKFCSASVMGIALTFMALLDYNTSSLILFELHFRSSIFFKVQCFVKENQRVFILCYTVTLLNQLRIFSKKIIIIG
jgi:hypothetical protein